MDAGTPPPLPVQVGLANPQVLTASGQRLRLFLVNTTGQKIAIGSQKPQFSLSFVIGSQAAAMATTSALREAKVSVSQEGSAIDWTCLALTSGTPSWMLSPSGSTLLGIGSQATVVFDIASLAPTQPGLTSLTLSYNGISAYSNGSVTLPIVKLPAPPVPVINSFSAGTPTDPTATDGNPMVTLTFEVENAATIMIPEADYVAQALAGQQSIPGSSENPKILR